MKESSRLREYGKTHISPKGINRGGFLQNHAAVDGDDMAVHDVDSPEQTDIRAVMYIVAETTVRCTNIREAGSTPALSTSLQDG